MGALFQDGLAERLSVVTWDSVSAQPVQFLVRASMKTEARNDVRIGIRSTEEYKRSAGEELTVCDYSKTLHYT
jgi:hypothetical protein